MTATVAGRELGMSAKSKALEISVICALFILLALWGIVWDITSGLLASGIDGIMLLGVCAMMAGIFLLILLVHLNHAGVLPTPAFLRAEPKLAAAAKPAAPAVSATPAGTAAAPKAAAPAPPAAGAAPATPPKPAPAAPTAAAPPSASAAPPAPAKPATPAASVPPPPATEK